MQKAKLNKLTTPFFILLPILAIVGTIYTLSVNGFYWQTAVLALLYTGLTGLSITAGYHRLFAHKTYKASWPVRLLFVIFGSAAVQGSVLEWCTDHRNHHRYTDKEGDPYSVTRGFWHAHIGWIFTLDPSKRNFDNVKELQDDLLLRLQHKYYFYFAVFFAAVLPVLLATCWGDPWGGLFIAGALRLTINHHFTFFINSLCHYWGKLTYERGTARDNWFMSLFTYGEGFHNFHHKFAIDYRNGIRWFHFDPSKWLIFVLAKMGLASNLKRVHKDVILQHRLDMHEEQLREAGPHCETKLENWLKPMREQIKQLQLHIKQLKDEYQQLKQKKFSSVSHQVAEYKERIATYRKQIKLAKKARRRTIRAWFTIANAALQNGRSLT